MGLIQFENFAGSKFTKLPQKLTVHYYESPLELTLPNDLDNDLAVGTVLLTRAGYDLARICDCHAADGFFDHVYDIWANQSLVPKRERGPAS
jgi:hypothetical protein